MRSKVHPQEPACLESQVDSRGIVLRLATDEDCRQVFAWRNDPWLMSFSTSQSPVEWSDHELWFAKAIKNPDQLLLIICSDSERPMGVLRYDRNEYDQALISIYLAQKHTGKGYGSAALNEGNVMAFKRWPLKSIQAWVRADNQGSVQLFQRSGFANDHETPNTKENHVFFELKRQGNK